MRRSVLYERMIKVPPAQLNVRRASRWFNGSARPEAGASPERSAARPEGPASSEPDSIDSAGSEFRIREGHIHISLSPVGCIVAAFVLCSVFLVAYSIGKRAVAGGLPNTPPTITAVQEQGQPEETAAGTTTEATAPAAGETASNDSALNRLLSPPGGESTIRTVSETSTPVTPGANLKYLWIQSIRADSAAELAAARAEAAEIVAFLQREGVPAQITSVRNGIIICGKEGFPNAATADRASFQQRIERLGKLYRKQGGRYSFNGPVWK